MRGNKWSTDSHGGTLKYKKTRGRGDTPIGHYKYDIYMEKTTNNNYPATTEDLIEAMMQDPSGRYKHLQFILNRKKSHNLGMEQKYLVVNSAGFGVYELNSIDYSNGNIQMIFTNPATGNPAEINLDVCNSWILQLST